MSKVFFDEINAYSERSPSDDKPQMKEFYSYLLISQLETVQSVNQLEKQSIHAKIRSDLTDQAIDLLTKKCNYLENAISKLVSNFSSLNISYDKMSVSFGHQQYYSNFQFFNQVSSENGSSARESSVPPPTEFDTTNIKASFAPLVQVCCQEKEKFQASENNAFVDNSDKVQASDQVSPTPCYFCKIKMRNNYARNKRFSSNENSCANVTKFKALFGLEQFKEIQRLFNKRVKYEVNRKFGRNYLADHQVRELDVKEMHSIKRKVLKIFAPFPMPIKSAWSNAMNSLRQDRHQLKKKIK